MTTPESLADQFIDTLRSLPPAPQILPKLLELLQDTDSNGGRIADLIALDPALTARTLKVCNSAQHRGNQPVRDLNGAVLRLGFSQIYQIVAGLIGQQTMSGPQPGYGIAAGELWKHSAATAVAGRVIAPEVGVEPNLLFTAALLHDLGKLALSSTLKDRYNDIAALTESTGRSFIEVEQELLGTDHAVVGGRLLERWSFPKELQEAVRHHHDPARSETHPTLAAGVHLADMLAHLVGFGFGHCAYAIRARPESLSLLRLSPPDIERLIVTTQSAMADFDLLKAG